jgi:cellulose synthase/poly-beta-1,6-N-acetylglucosamine synthase-like glycosyltransferase
MLINKNNLQFQIIMPAYNEEDSLEIVLEHAQKIGYLENIVVVDDASTDATSAILERWCNNFGLRAIKLTRNCNKEGALRVAMEALRDAGELQPYTLLLDSDSMIVGDFSGNPIVLQIEGLIKKMRRDGYMALALRIDAAINNELTFFKMCAFADYTAMQVDQWIVGGQGQLWVINGPGGIFETNKLLTILQSIVPDFETGDLLITVKLMTQKHPVGFCPEFCVETFVPNDTKSYFQQRRRWERGTTKVLWDEISFYLSLFSRFRLLALSTLIHLSMHIGFIVTLGSLHLGFIRAFDIIEILIYSMVFWFLVSLIKGLLIKIHRPKFKLLRYCGFAILNCGLWLVVTTPARLTGFVEGVFQIFFTVRNLPQKPRMLTQYAWLGIARRGQWLENDSRKISND